MRVRLIAPVTAALVAGTLALTAAPSQAAPSQAAVPSAPTASAAAAAPSVAIPISQTLPDGLGTFTGTFTPTRFSGTNGQLTATGLLTGTVTDLATGATTPVSQTEAVPAQVTGSCTVLDLTLGPLHLNLLGLVVDLNQVQLTITAQQGPGNLLGNLLCAVANLLNGGSPTAGLAGLLNRILGLLGGL